MKAILGLAILAAAIPAQVSAAELITNGGFETGTYAGWTASVLAGSNGNLSIDTPGSTTPVAGFGTAANALGGNFYSVTSQGGPGTYSLSQAFLLPVGTTSALLTFQMFVNNYGGNVVVDPAGLNHAIANANQHARVDILTAGASAFSTNPADIVANLYLGAGGASVNPYSAYTFNLLSLGLQAGTGYQIRFSEVDNRGFFHQGVDNVSVVALSSGVPEPATWAMMILGFGAIGAAMRRRNTAVRVTYA